MLSGSGRIRCHVPLLGKIVEYDGHYYYLQKGCTLYRKNKQAFESFLGTGSDTGQI